MQCPICSKYYKVTKSPVLNVTWYDCTNCNLTKEKCEEKFKSENSLKAKCVDSDLIYEFRKLVWSDDDEDIKGVF